MWLAPSTMRTSLPRRARDERVRGRGRAPATLRGGPSDHSIPASQSGKGLALDISMNAEMLLTADFISINTEV
ncbi:MAG: hypothetical protein ACI9P3_004215 [Bradyrhizobium sp.]|jgi:hypothetical protein